MEKVIPNTSDELRQAVENFVATKRFLNSLDPKPPGFGDWAASLSPDHFMDQDMPGWACWPKMTLKAVLPFFDADRKAESKSAFVPVKSLVGSSHSWHESSLPSGSKSVADAIAHFTEEGRACDSHVAHVSLVSPLGIFYSSGEGKNRVAFLARRGIEWMPCNLVEQDYPAANRLEVVEVFEGSIRTWLCFLDSKLVLTIPYPEFTLSILDAYGVKRAKNWQLHRPMLATVMNSLRQQSVDRDKGMRSGICTPVDLDYLTQCEFKVRTPILEEPIALLWNSRIEFKRALVIKVVGALAACFLAGLYAPLPGKVSTLLSVGAGSLLAGLLGTLCLPMRVRPEVASDVVVAALAADRDATKSPTHSQ
jgi:hypothetical protein